MSTNSGSGSDTEEDPNDPCVTREPTNPSLTNPASPLGQIRKDPNEGEIDRKSTHNGASTPTRVNGLPMKRAHTVIVCQPPRKLPRTLLSKEELAKGREEESRRVRSLRAQATEEAVRIQSTNGEAAPLQPLLKVQWEEFPKSGRVVCFDLETTGFGLEDDIVEVGAVEVVDGVRTGAVFHSYARPHHKFHPGATAVHGLTEELLKDEPPSEFVVSSFLDWVGNSVLVAHNALFDIRMLSQAVRNYGLEELFHASGAYCSMRYFRKLFPGRPSGLDDMGTLLKINDRYQRARDLHGALVDAELLAACYRKLIVFDVEKDTLYGNSANNCENEKKVV